MKSIPILHIIKGLGQGGAERLLVSTIRQHSPQYSFHIVYFLSFKNQLADELSNVGATVHLIKANHPLLMIFRIRKLVKIIRKISPKLIHAHLPVSGFIAAISSKLTGIPLLYSEHNIPSRYQLITKLFHPFTLKISVKVICVSPMVQRELLRIAVGNQKIIVIENGTDITLFAPNLYVKSEIRKQLNLPIQNLIIGTVAVFTDQKRLDRWLNICKRIHTRNPNICFVIAGHGPLEKALKDSAVELISKKALYFTGRTSVPERWMAAMDIYLMTSDFEGLPVAMLEAMSLELPVVASAVGGIPDAIQHNFSGFLYPANQPDRAVEYIEGLCADPSLRNYIGRNARSAVIKRFNTAVMVKNLEVTYYEILNLGYSENSNS